MIATRRVAASEVQAKITAMWDRAAERFDTHTGHGLNTERETTAWTRALRDLLPPPPATVLDVGCGTGVIALLLAEMATRCAASISLSRCSRAHG